jgi:hypothetical protein
MGIPLNLRSIERVAISARTPNSHRWECLSANRVPSAKRLDAVTDIYRQTMKSATTADLMPVRLTMLRSQRTMVDVPMKQVFKNSSQRIITVRVLVLGKQWGNEQTMASGDILSIPVTFLGKYVLELL